tara:strand:+ start:1361 stop:1777 length:417 start_codon:yes stop_codon:yes gene_type:complete
MNSKNELIFQKSNIGLGKRKQAVARVYLIPGNGTLIVNKISGEKYFQFNRTYLNTIWAPLKALNLNKQYNVLVIVNGGGLTGQADSIQLGISRLISKISYENRKCLKSLKFLSRDSRIKERKKYGLRKARKAPQYSKR